MPILKTLLRQNQLHRSVYYLCIFTTILCIIAGAKWHYYGNSFNLDYSPHYAPVPIPPNNENINQNIKPLPKPVPIPGPPYNEYIDQNGNYLPYSGYKILQLIEKPIPSDVDELYNYLNQQDELKLYFKLVPISAYHITLTNLKNKTSYDENQLKTLITEQELLDADDTSTPCVGKKFFIIDKNEIRMEIELTDTDFLNSFKEYQKRWTKDFPELINQNYISFYVTVAYQYKDIPNADILKQLEKVLKDFQLFPITFQLDPIEISSYENLITYTAVLPDRISSKEN